MARNVRGMLINDRARCRTVVLKSTRSETWDVIVIGRTGVRQDLKRKSLKAAKDIARRELSKCALRARKKR